MDTFEIKEEIKELKREYDYKFKKIISDYENLKKQINYIVVIFATIILHNCFNDLLLNNST
jgi:hypothetical protein